MGVIKRQGIKRGVISYIGVGIGFLSTIFIFPRNFEAYGLIQALINFTALLAPILMLGVNSLTIKFFEEVSNKKNGHNGWLGFLLLTSFSIAFFWVTVGAVSKDSFLHFLSNLNFDSRKLEENYLALCFLCLFSIGVSLLKAYVSNFQRIVVPNIISDLSLKVALPILVILNLFGKISLSGVVVWFIGYNAIVFFSLVLYSIFLKQFYLKINFQFYTRERLKRMGLFAAYGILGTLGGVLVTRIDTIMVAGLIEGYEKTGIYSFSNNVSNIITIPFSSFFAIASPLISKHIYNEEMEDIRDLYVRSSISLLAVGLAIFFLLWLSIDELFLMTGNYDQVSLGKYAFFCLGLSKVIDMVTGINGQIITFSKYYRFNLLAVFLLGFLNIGLNYYFVPLYGLLGAAIGTLVSLTTFNLIKYLFVLFVFKMQPFTLKTVLVIIFGFSAFCLASILPDSGLIIVNIILNSIVFGLSFLFLMLYFNPSKDLTSLYKEGVKKLSRFFR